MTTITPTLTPTIGANNIVPSPRQQRESAIGGMLINLKTNAEQQVLLTAEINNSNDDPATKAANRTTVLTPLEQNTVILGQSIKAVYDFGERLIRVLGVG